MDIFCSLLYFVDGGGSITALPTPVVVEELPFRAVCPFIHMGAKVVSLGLEQIRWQIFRMVSIIIGES